MDRNTLNISNVSLAPDAAGLYAWYAEIKLGRLDWAEIVENGQDVGETRLRGALEAFSYFFGRQRLNVEARSHFSTTWRGDLEEDLNRRLLNPQSQKLKASLQSPERREVLVSVISSACPVFAHPLYIGVADSLRVRLRQHSDEYFGLREAQREAPATFSEYTGEQTFAQRAFGLGLKEENLTVHFKPLEGKESMKGEVLRDTLEAAEWLLNRWSTPLLGRK